MVFPIIFRFYLILSGKLCIFNYRRYTHHLLDLLVFDILLFVFLSSIVVNFIFCCLILLYRNRINSCVLVLCVVTLLNVQTINSNSLYIFKVFYMHNHVIGKHDVIIYSCPVFMTFSLSLTLLPCPGLPVPC